VGVGRNTTTTTTKALRIEQALSIEYGASKIARWGMKRGWRRTGCCGDPISSHVVPPKCSYKMHFSHDLRMKRLARFSLCVCVCVCLLWNLQAFSQTFFRICNNVDGWVGFVFAGSSEEGVFCKESGRDASTPDTTEGSDL
jgi:hypothetical protein